MLGNGLIVALALVFAPAPQTIDFDELRFMSGHWLDPGDFPRQGPRWSELFWTPPMGGEMYGLNRSTAGFGRHSFDFLRLKQEADGIVLYLSPEGGAAIPYRLVRASSTEAVFENPRQEEFQRIIYRRDGNRLLMSLSEIESGHACDRDFLPFEEAVEQGPAAFRIFDC